MGLYTRRQLVILLALLATAGVGLAAGHWRRTHPDLAMRLEQVGLGEPGLAGPTPGADGAEPRRPPLTPGEACAGEARARNGGACDTPLAPEPSSAVRKADPTTDGSAVAASQVAPAAAGGRGPRLLLDLNRATAEQLIDLPGVGPWLAARIVEARESVGPFASVDDLRRVRGFGPVRIERLRQLVRAGQADPAPAPGGRPP